jgi:hypothetical protein
MRNYLSKALAYMNVALKELITYSLLVRWFFELYPSTGAIHGIQIAQRS